MQTVVISSSHATLNLFFTTQRALLAFTEQVFAWYLQGICHRRNCNFVCSIVHQTKDFTSSFFSVRKFLFFRVFRLGEERFSIKINKKNPSRWLLKQEKTAEKSFVLGCYVKNTKQGWNFVLIYTRILLCSSKWKPDENGKNRKEKSPNNEHKHNKWYFFLWKQPGISSFRAK